MGSSNEDIIKAIQHYQERLERYNLNKSEDKMLYVLRKLSKLPIKTLHLETTGVGRTVNALKKLNGKVGDSAKDLVVSWKEMVLEEEKAAQDTSLETEEDADSVYSSDNENQALQIEDGKENVNNQSDNESDSEDYSHKKELSSKSKHQNYLENKTSKYKELDKHNLSNLSNSDEEESYKPSRKREHSTDSSSDERSRHNLKKNKKAPEHSSSKGKDKSTKVEKDKRHENKDRHKNNDDIAKSKREPEQLNHKLEKRSKHEDKTEKASHSSKHKSSTDSHSTKKESKTKKEKEKHKSRRESSNPEMKLKESSNDEKNKSKNSHSSSSSHSKSKHNNENGERKTSKEKVKKVSKEKIINGIDSESGASFAEALGMCGPVSSQSSKKKSSSEKKPSRSSSKSKYEEGSSSSKSKYEESSSSSKSKHEENYSSSKSKYEESSSSSSSKLVPDLLVEEPQEPLNICLSSLLPEITPNYKPTPINLDAQLKRIYNDDEALSRVMSNKNQRTKVYSGNKIVGKVESLFQICVRILQEHIDALEYTGGVPYSILKPILDRATPDQLFNLEHHNPYLIEETDELWQLHCQKEFRTKKREELESWREMYMRCLDEREARLNFITANIKQSQDKSEPIRTTKMAYIDSGFVKPPRNVARQQAKNGTVRTDRKITPTQKLSALAKTGDAEKIALPNPSSRAAERTSNSSSAAMKPKKAPLMAKTLSFLKNRFKR